MSSFKCQKLAEFAEDICIVAKVFGNRKVVFETEYLTKLELEGIEAEVKEIMETPLKRTKYEMTIGKKTCVVRLL
jgi:hypothetical protein